MLVRGITRPIAERSPDGTFAQAHGSVESCQLEFEGERVNPDGSTQKYGFIVKHDNKDYPITGKDPGGADTIAVKLVDANQIESTSKKGREVVYASKVEVSQDGKVMTITTKGKNPDGEPFDNLQVYDRH